MAHQKSAKVSKDASARPLDEAGEDSAENSSAEIERLRFDDNRLLADLAGEHDAHFVVLEQSLGVRIDPRGNMLSLSGPPEARAQAVKALSQLYERLQNGQPVTSAEVRAAGRFAKGGLGERRVDDKITIKTPKRLIAPRTTNQGAYLKALQENELTFGVGPAGTGKTYLAVAHAVHLYASGAVERIILSRPAVEAGEQIGFLPGDMKDKVDPYMRPLYDALYDMLSADYVERRLQSGEIEIAPLAFMRGRTLTRAAVILDEAQNATIAQMKMFLTRLGEGSHMAVTGDPTQSDLKPGEISGLADALDLLDGVKGINLVRFKASDVVRHALVSRIIKAYDARKTPKTADAVSKARNDRD